MWKSKNLDFVHFRTAHARSWIRYHCVSTVHILFKCFLLLVSTEQSSDFDLNFVWLDQHPLHFDFNSFKVQTSSNLNRFNNILAFKRYLKIAILNYLFLWKTTNHYSIDFDTIYKRTKYFQSDKTSLLHSIFYRTSYFSPSYSFHDKNTMSLLGKEKNCAVNRLVPVFSFVIFLGFWYPFKWVFDNPSALIACECVLSGRHLQLLW